jgi:putative peptidoglycan lipid II flippase
MSKSRKQLLSSMRATTLWTMVSRVLGLLREMIVARLLGLAAGGVADALVIAMSIPNLFRQLFGEGALTAAFLPMLSRRLETDRPSAWRLASVVLAWLAVGLSAIVVLLELLLGAAWLFLGSNQAVALLLGLTAVTFPYVLLICLAAQINAVLNALGRFGIGAAMPVLMNLVLIAGALAAPWLTPEPVTQAYVVAGSVLVGGLVQLAVVYPALRSLGFRYDYQPAEHREELKTILVTMLPLVLGLAVTQINVLTDRLIAWGLSAPPGDTRGISWLGGVPYPMETGAAAAVYYGERLYQLPIGILGVAVATVIFPRLARHAARGTGLQLRADLTLGVRLVLFLALPASVGMVLLAEPLAVLLFQGGRFTADDEARTARLIACFGVGVWAYCTLPTLVRGYYALGRHGAAVRIALATMALNLALDLTLIWPMAEAGLAIATAISAAVQVAILTAGLQRLRTGLMFRPLLRTLVRSGVATAVMGVCCYGSLLGLRAAGVSSRLLLAGVPLGVSLVVYVAMAALLKCDELRLIRGSA